jgi:hypothetical protein
MIPLHEYTRSIDKDFVDPLDMCKERGLVQKSCRNTDEMEADELRDYYQMCSSERRKYRVKWAHYIKKCLRWKKPYLLNGAAFTKIDDDDFEDLKIDSSEEEEAKKPEVKPPTPAPPAP